MRLLIKNPSTFMYSFFRVILFPLVLAMFAFGGTLLAQNPRPTPTPTPDEDTGQLKTFEVRLPVTVTLKKELVTGLSRGDFAVFEDGVQQEVTFFTDEKNNPAVYVGVLMDTSPSAAGKLGFSKEAAINFIHTVTRLRKDKAAFMTFDNEVMLRQDFTDKLDLLQKAVDNVKKA